MIIDERDPGRNFNGFFLRDLLIFQLIYCFLSLFCKNALFKIRIISDFFGDSAIIILIKCKWEPDVRWEPCFQLMKLRWDEKVSMPRLLAFRSLAIEQFWYSEIHYGVSEILKDLKIILHFYVLLNYRYFFDLRARILELLRLRCMHYCLQQ
jgi:hypothetical protein